MTETELRTLGVDVGHTVMHLPDALDDLLPRYSSTPDGADLVIGTMAARGCWMRILGPNSHGVVDKQPWQCVFTHKRRGRGDARGIGNGDTWYEAVCRAALDIVTRCPDYCQDEQQPIGPVR